jgi:hypothetical protein
MRYNDTRSRKQVGQYITYRLDTEAQNKKNLARWTPRLAAEWYEARMREDRRSP